MESIETNSNLLSGGASLVRDIKCEELVLGTMMTSEGAFHEVAEFLSPECFFLDKNKSIYNAIVSVVNKGLFPDIINVSAEIAKMGSRIEPYEVAEIAMRNASVSIEAYALRLKELALRRDMWNIGMKVSSVGVDESNDLDKIRQEAINSINLQLGKSDTIFTLSDSLESLHEAINRNLSGGGLTGTATGYKRIDEKGGLQKTDLIIIAGETSQGKTSFALSIVRNAIFEGAKVAVYSLEMTRQQLSARLVASLSGVSSSAILYSSHLNDGELKQIDEAICKLPGDNLFFDDSSTSNIDSILISIRSMKMRYDIDGVVVDYLQIVGVNNKQMSREQQMGDASRRLKNIAKELNIWVIAVSQLSRDSNNPIPNLNRLRDSGQIAEAADVVMLVYRPEYYHRDNFPTPFDNSEQFPVQNAAMIDVAKGRNIGTFQFLLGFNNKTTSFFEMGSIDNPDYASVANQEPVEEDAPF